MRSIRRASSLTMRSTYRWRTRDSSVSEPGMYAAGSGCRHLAVSVHEEASTDSSPVREVITSPATPTWSPRSTSCLPVPQRLGPDGVGRQHDLQVTGLVAQPYEDQLAVLAGEHDRAPRPRPSRPCACPGPASANRARTWTHRRRTVETQRVRVDAGLAQPLQLVVPYAFLLRQPPGRQPGGVGGLLDLLDLGDQGGRGRRCVEPRLEQRRQEALGPSGGEPDAYEVAALLEAHEPRRPHRVVLRVRQEQRLELPELRRHREQAVRQPRDRPGADRRAALEHRPQHGEVERDAGDPDRRGVLGELGHHELVQAVLRVAVAAHQVEGEARPPPRHEAQQATAYARAVERLDHHAALVGRVAEAPKRHREPSLGVPVAPAVGVGDQLGHLLAADRAVPPDPYGVAGALHPAYGLAHLPHVTALEVELAQVEDGLVAEFEGVQPAAAERRGGALAGAQHAGDPRVRPALGEPRADRGVPRLGVAERVAAGEADRPLDAVGDAGAASSGRG